MHKVLGPEFFVRPTLLVARGLLGKYLVRKVGRKEIALMITETEGYQGHDDLGSHAQRGQTLRNAPIYGAPGTTYIYFTYGMHWMLNIVTEKETYPAAVLIRGLETFSYSREYENVVLNGPGKLTKFLQIDKKLNGQILGKKTGLWVEDRGVVIKPKDIKKTPRIGIPYAGAFEKKPWRFVINSPSQKWGR